MSENPLSDLNEIEVAELIQAVTFYQYISIIELPGAFLLQTLKEIFPQAVNLKSVFQFKNNKFTKIFNEPIIALLLESINNREFLSFKNKCNKKNIETIGQPLQIQTDFNYGCQYVIFYDKKHGLKKSRLENLKKIQYHAEPSGNPANVNSINILEKNQREAHLKIKYNDESERIKIINKLREHHLNISIKEEPKNILDVTVISSDLWQLIPWISTFLPNLFYLEDNSGNLKKKLQQHIEETLKNYGD